MLVRFRFSPGPVVLGVLVLVLRKKGPALESSSRTVSNSSSLL